MAFLSDLAYTATYIVLWGASFAGGIYLLVVRQFRIRTLWDKYAHDPTQGMRSYRFERLQFKFDYQDPGANPEDITGFEDYVLYQSSDDDEASQKPQFFKATMGIEQSLLAKKKKEELEKKSADTGSSTWPWENPDYNFAKIHYREGIRHNLEEGETKEE